MNHVSPTDKDVSKELVKVQELIKANIQRSRVIQDQVSFDTVSISLNKY